MKKTDDLTLLLIAYLRPHHVSSILEIAFKSGVRKFYISIDYPKVKSENNLELHAAVLRAISDFEVSSGIQVEKFIRDMNVGCTPSVLSSCEWVFQNEASSIILEDDCIPSPDFFEFCRAGLKYIENSSDVWFFCGSQFAPTHYFPDTWALSKYPMTWGWGTTRERWNEMTSAFRSRNTVSMKNRPDLTLSERAYWNAGARRAYRGFVDAWDTPLAREMLTHKKFALVPSVPLVSNVGGDSVATHTLELDKGLNMTTSAFINPSSPPVQNPIADEWIRNSYFKIRLRHLITTRITWLRDYLFSYQNKPTGLLQLWQNATIDKTI